MTGWNEIDAIGIARSANASQLSIPQVSVLYPGAFRVAVDFRIDEGARVSYQNAPVIMY